MKSENIWFCGFICHTHKSYPWVCEPLNGVTSSSNLLEGFCYAAMWSFRTWQMVKLTKLFVLWTFYLDTGDTGVLDHYFLFWFYCVKDHSSMFLVLFFFFLTQILCFFFFWHNTRWQFEYIISYAFFWIWISVSPKWMRS